MTNDELRRVTQRIADARDTTRRALDASAAPARTATDRIGASFAVGDRVLDLRGGREGEVADVRPADRDGAAGVWVRYDDDSRALRTADDLIARPKPPAARR